MTIKRGPYRRIVGPPQLSGTEDIRKRIISVRRRLKLSDTVPPPPVYIEEGFVYFVRDAAGHIKIGMATNLASRISSIQSCNSGEIELLGFMDHKKGQYEKVIHGKFRHLKLRGEWFLAGDDLLSFIKENTRQ